MTIPTHEIEVWIKDMDYITITPRTIDPSYYKLTDGTIIKAHTQVQHVTADPKNPKGFSLNSNSITVAYIPKEKRKPDFFHPYDNSEIQKSISEEDMEVVTLRENYNVYDLSNGMVLSLKTVVGQVNKTSLVTPEGEPVYMVNTTPLIKIKPNK